MTKSIILEVTYVVIAIQLKQRNQYILLKVYKKHRGKLCCKVLLLYQVVYTIESSKNICLQLSLIIANMSYYSRSALSYSISFLLVNN